VSAVRAQRLLISAGEPSGDRLGAAVAARLRQRRSELILVGVGGPAMAAAGVDVEYPAARLGAMGFLEVLESVPRHWALYRKLRAQAREGRFRAAVLVDYPGFHLRLGAALRQAGVPVVQFVAPQLWAWHPERIRLLARAADRLATVLPFEADWFANRGVPATFVGHPLTVRRWPSRAEARERLGLPPDEEVLGIFPGARAAEVAAHWPVFREAALRLLAESRCRRAVVAAVPAGRYPEAGPLTLVPDAGDEILAASTCALVKSGTTALEAAWVGTPLVVAYRVNWPTYRLARRLLTVPWISLVNLVLGQALVPEFWKPPVESQALVAALRPLLNERSPERTRQQEGFRRVRELLGSRDAAGAVAEMVLGLAGV